MFGTSTVVWLIENTIPESSWQPLEAAGFRLKGVTIVDRAVQRESLLMCESAALATPPSQCANSFFNAQIGFSRSRIGRPA